MMRLSVPLFASGCPLSNSTFKSHQLHNTVVDMAEAWRVVAQHASRIFAAQSIPIYNVRFSFFSSRIGFLQYRASNSAAKCDQLGAHIGHMQSGVQPREQHVKSRQRTVQVSGPDAAGACARINFAKPVHTIPSSALLIIVSELLSTSFDGSHTLTPT